MTPAERMQGEQCEATAQEIEVLPCNWWPVQVYLRCQQSMLAGMSGAVLMGVSATEVRAACALLRVPAREWPDVIDGVQALGGMVAKIENKRASDRAASASRAANRRK